MISDDVSRLDEMRSQVTEFHANNPEVWKMFVGFTFEMIMSGRKHYSVNAVFERLRWEVDIKHGPDNSFKLNNNYRAFYARRFHRMYPEYAGFFRTRKQTSKEADATNLPELGPDDYPQEAVG